jgi:UDP-N-acetylmuramyl pentapeptide phosphotransferase/UDP-N-acetylglucosamine-1-phosphate transferase
VQDVPPIAEVLAQTFMPGPITFLLNKQSIVPDLVTAGSAKVAVRIPQHPLTLSLLQQLNFPLAAPSANVFGYISPTTAQHVYEGLSGNIPYILDGGAAGAVAISSIALAFLALNGDQYLIAALSIVTAGATLGFLVWNKSPAKIYMGDAGALFLGVLLATLTVRFEPTSRTQIGSYLTPFFLLAIPILDTSVAVFSRLRRHASPFQGGQDHLSHRLIRFGLSRKQSAFVLWALCGLFASIAILLSKSTQQISLILIIGSLIFWIMLFALFFRTKDN